MECREGAYVRKRSPRLGGQASTQQLTSQSAAGSPYSCMPRGLTGPARDKAVTRKATCSIHTCTAQPSELMAAPSGQAASTCSPLYSTFFTSWTCAGNRWTGSAGEHCQIERIAGHCGCHVRGRAPDRRARRPSTPPHRPRELPPPGRQQAPRRSARPTLLNSSSPELDQHK